MKKTIFFLIIAVFLNIQNSICQTQSNVKTPKGSTVIAYITPELPAGTRSYADYYYSLVYGITPISTYNGYSSTGRFNCHGYAWHMQGSLSDPRWIGYGSTTHEDIYMSDGSYVQVLNEMYPGKVSLVSDDHSAMTTATAGTWKSKWGPYVLCEHTRYNSPYDATSVKYYVSTSIAGSTDALCNTSSRVFTAVSIQNATYSWSVGPGLSKTENGNSCTVNGNGYSTGSTWIEVTITSPIGGGQYDVKTSPRLNFWLGTEAITVYSEGGDGGYVDNSYYFWVSSYSGDLEWYVYPIGDLTDLGGGLASIYFDTPGLAYIWVIDTDECGESEPEFFEFEVYGDYLLSPI